MYCSEVIVKTLEYLPVNNIARLLTVNKLWHYSALHAHLWNREEFALPEQINSLRYPVKNFVNPLDFRPSLVVSSNISTNEDVLDFIGTFPNGVKRLRIRTGTRESITNLLLGLSRCKLNLEVLRYYFFFLRKRLNGDETRQLISNNRETLRKISTNTNLHFDVEESYPKLATILCFAINVTGNQLPNLKQLSCSNLSVENTTSIPNLDSLMLYSLSNTNPIPSSAIANVKNLLLISLSKLNTISISELSQLKTLQLDVKLEPSPVIIQSSSLEQLIIRDRACKHKLSTLDFRGCLKLKSLTCGLGIFGSETKILLPQDTLLDTIVLVTRKYKHPIPYWLKEHLKSYTQRVVFIPNYY